MLIHVTRIDDSFKEFFGGAKVKLNFADGTPYGEINVTFRTPQPRPAAAILIQFLEKAVESWQESCELLDDVTKTIEAQDKIIREKSEEGGAE